ncbi:uncharacterized protein TNIN_212881 [Trichonephila inaurata madagascariensis]|uniref:Uncharacterized protein n=1 Tax=Trichonephila inaurata madagascariensis TaxID=2747483 RepID=A0A8X6WW50_9ARAC|nr:uncharacterized protein TNIN_212881 [Trichonephila inaurata madagascariensis]
MISEGRYGACYRGCYRTSIGIFFEEEWSEDKFWEMMPHQMATLCKCNGLNRETPSEQWTHMPYRTPMQHDPASQRNSVSEETRKRERENNALALLAKFCNAQCYKLTGYPIRKPINKSHQDKMDVARKQNSDAKHCNNPDARKGKQLTSIIDQLTINKTKDAVPDSKNKKKDSQTWQHQIKNDGKLCI